MSDPVQNTKPTLPEGKLIRPATPREADANDLRHHSIEAPPKRMAVRTHAAADQREAPSQRHHHSSNREDHDKVDRATKLEVREQVLLKTTYQVNPGTSEALARAAKRSRQGSGRTLSARALDEERKRAQKPNGQERATARAEDPDLSHKARHQKPPAKVGIEDESHRHSLKLTEARMPSHPMAIRGEVDPVHTSHARVIDFARYQSLSTMRANQSDLPLHELGISHIRASAEQRIAYQLHKDPETERINLTSICREAKFMSDSPALLALAGMAYQFSTAVGERAGFPSDQLESFVLPQSESPEATSALLASKGRAAEWIRGLSSGKASGAVIGSIARGGGVIPREHVPAAAEAALKRLAA